METQLVAAPVQDAAGIVIMGPIVMQDRPMSLFDSSRTGMACAPSSANFDSNFEIPLAIAHYSAVSGKLRIEKRAQSNQTVLQQTYLHKTKAPLALGLPSPFL